MNILNLFSWLAGILWSRFSGFLMPKSNEKEKAADKKLFPGSVFSMDLQWFAAEDEGRTEEPTEQKIRKARKRVRSLNRRTSLLL